VAEDVAIEKHHAALVACFRQEIRAAIPHGRWKT
jgi:hypothetical protein